MSKIKIVTDSSITIEPDLLKELDITVVPLSVMVDGVVYSDNDLKEKGQFLELMKSGKALPKTSQPPVGLFADVYQELQSQGADSIISIHICHSLSGTVEAARQGAMLSGVDVKIIDSGFTDQAMAFQVIEAAKLAQSGHSVEDILKEIDVIKGKTDLFIGVSTLENLIKGGRIGRVSGLLSSLLNIKVIMQMRDEKLHPIVKGRGQKTFTKWIDNFAEDITTVKVAKMAISYSGDDAFAKTLKEKFQPLLDCPITVLETGSIIQTHTGEDAFAVLICYA